MTPLERLAALVAIETPLRFNKYGRTTYVRRELVAEIRAELSRMGFDWRQAHKTARKQQG